MNRRFEYQLVRLANGSASIRSLDEGETFHPVVGPAAEAEALYVNQLRLRDRMRAQPEPFVIWDIGLGAAANVLSVLRAGEEIRGEREILSFDHSLEPLRFALRHKVELGYLTGFERAIECLLAEGVAQFEHGSQRVHWRFLGGDFPTLVGGDQALSWPKPDAVLFDAYSPARNPEMWTQPLFARLHELMDPMRPCALPTYSRSTLLRVSLLLAGFYVGAGGATGEKEETTIASNALALLERPLGRDWLTRARRSTSAEPLWGPVYKQERLRPETWDRLQAHPQFAG